MKQKIALLSNVNMNYAIRMLSQNYEVYQAEGYGNELGLLLNPESSYQKFDPSVTFLVIDLMELLEHNLSSDGSTVRRWFELFKSSLCPDRIYYLADAYLWGLELEVAADPNQKRRLESLWQEQLAVLTEQNSNVRILPYHHLIEQMGAEHAFSLKMWYLGAILLTNEAQKRLCELIAGKVQLSERTAKKVLLLDLDNTLWGGLAGEAEHSPVVLSEEHSGLAYKNLQRVIYQMQSQGVLLGIVSKNNERDAMEVIAKHPHMVLRPEYFAARRINWEPKHKNIQEIARELNVGTDSIVFWDDSNAERKLVKQMLPEVMVPAFPERPEELAPAMVAIYHEYFEKDIVTIEDREKTNQYHANAKRKELQSSAGDYDSYLQQLDMVLTRRKPQDSMDRLVQLINKTNQFNLTGKRTQRKQMQQFLREDTRRIYLYQVADCFGDSGIVAAAVVVIPENAAMDSTPSFPVLEVFVMSCRVMGRGVEIAMVEDIEEQLQQEGFKGLEARYCKSAKNAPVELLFEQLGYQVTDKQEDGSKEYRILFENRPERKYFVRRETVI